MKKLFLFLLGLTLFFNQQLLAQTLSVLDETEFKVPQLSRAEIFEILDNEIPGLDIDPGLPEPYKTCAPSVDPNVYANGTFEFYGDLASENQTFKPGDRINIQWTHLSNQGRQRVGPFSWSVTHWATKYHVSIFQI